MIYTVDQAANKLNVSKVTIYNKLKLNQFKDMTVTKQGQTMIDEDLLNLIKDSIKITNKFNDVYNTDTSGEPQEGTETEETQQDINTDDDLLNLNKELIGALLQQLKEKDSQIHELHKLIENNQVLLKEKPQDIKQLEEHFQDLDNKLMDIKNKMEQSKEHHEQEPKGFFSKIFKK